MIQIKLIKDIFDIYARHYQSLGDYSATTIIDSPRRVALYNRYGDALAHTPESQVASLIGTAVHEKVEKLLHLANVVNPQYWIEKSMAVPIEMYGDANGYSALRLLGGKPDAFVPEDKHLIDIKTCKTWKIIYDPNKEEWTKQTNVYRWMLGQKGKEIRKITVVAFFLDWVESQALRRHDYPQAPVVEYEIDVWPMEEAEQFVYDRMHLHYDCEEVEDDMLPACTPEEMWEDETKFALMKDEKAKKAMKVFHDARDLPEAVRMACALPKVTANSFIEIRHGQRKRCNRYCGVTQHCNLYQSNRKMKDIFQLGGVM
jgi:hypothetical protein